MEILEAIRGRRATRMFTPKPVAAGRLEQLIAASIQAPSAMNRQAWHFTVVRNAALLDRISDRSKARMLQLMAPGTVPNELRQHLENPAFHLFYHAPALVVISTPMGDWAIEDAALAAQNLMLDACAQGLGTCWIGLAQRWLETEEGHQALKLPAHLLPVAPIIVGYPAEPHPPVPRNAPVIDWID